MVVARQRGVNYITRKLLHCIWLLMALFLTSGRRRGMSAFGGTGSETATRAQKPAFYRHFRRVQPCFYRRGHAMGSCALSRLVPICRATYDPAMAKKQLSGAQRERLAPLVRAMRNVPAFAGLLRKRGQFKGSVTSRVKTRRMQVTADFLWAVGIGKPGHRELAYSDSLLAKELLREDKMRIKKLRLGKSQYSGLSGRSLRREIASIRSQIYAPATPLRIRFQFNKFKKPAI
jgi:hypothetical protein